MTIKEIDQKIGHEGYVLGRNRRMGTFHLTIPPTRRAAFLGPTDIVLSEFAGSEWLHAESRRELPRITENCISGCAELGLDWVTNSYHCFIQ
jgi:hypothetical protein